MLQNHPGTPIWMGHATEGTWVSIDKEGRKIYDGKILDWPQNMASKSAQYIWLLPGRPSQQSGPAGRLASVGGQAVQGGGQPADRGSGCQRGAWGRGLGHGAGISRHRGASSVALRPNPEGCFGAVWQSQGWSPPFLLPTLANIVTKWKCGQQWANTAAASLAWVAHSALQVSEGT
jgi:hypothetical protein